MSVEAVRTRFPDGRWHFQHGPIDLIILAEGEHETVEHSHELAWRRFRNLLHELVHHIQTTAHLKYECPAAREKLAYAAQEKWLGLFNLSLASEFNIDPFTLKVATECAY